MLYKLQNDYHTQRNNRIDPTQTCQVTAMIMGLKASGIPFDYPSNEQPEDYLAKILDEPDAHDKLLREYPSLAERHPREVHAILSWAVNNKLCKRRVTQFSTKVSMQELLWRIARYRCASVMSGRFTSYGHLVTLVGFESGQDDLDSADSPGPVDLDQVQSIIVDDPWGDGKTGYREKQGNDVIYTLHEFAHLTRVYDSLDAKWAHLFSRDGCF